MLAPTLINDIAYPCHQKAHQTPKPRGYRYRSQHIAEFSCLLAYSHTGSGTREMEQGKHRGAQRCDSAPAVLGEYLL